MQLVPQCTLDEIDELLLHVRKGCLSHIPPTGGTSRNEGIHRVLNKSLKKSRIGIQFAIALLGAFFYIWNEKQLSGEQTRKKIRVVPPIESHFKTVDNGYIEERSEHFWSHGHYNCKKVPLFSISSKKLAMYSFQ